MSHRDLPPSIDLKRLRTSTHVYLNLAPNPRLQTLGRDDYAAAAPLALG
jgi:hypothetical protein